MYEIVVKNWWKVNTAWPDGLEPDGFGEPEIIQRDVETEDQAAEICQAYNATHEPGPLSRKAEYRDDGNDREYNGYPNYPTWNVQLWIDNDRAWYNAMNQLLKQLAEPVTADHVRGLVDQLRLPYKITDLDAHDWQHVRWEYLASHWEESRQEMLEDPESYEPMYDLGTALDQLKNQRILKEQRDLRNNGN